MVKVPAVGVAAFLSEQRARNHKHKQTQRNNKPHHKLVWNSALGTIGKEAMAIVEWRIVAVVEVCLNLVLLVPRRQLVASAAGKFLCGKDGALVAPPYPEPRVQVSCLDPA
jgi:hypothetical protein